MFAARSLSHLCERSLGELVGARLNTITEELVVPHNGDGGVRDGDSPGNGPANREPLRHVALMIGCIGRYVRNPELDLRAQMLSHAPSGSFNPAGDGAEDLMTWLDGLSRRITRRVSQEVAESGESFEADALLAVFGRLSEGLRTMTSIAVTLHLDRHERRHDELVRRFADFNLTLRHELRSPMNSILLGTEILESPGCDSGIRHKQLKAIRSALTHAEVLLLDADRLTTALSGDAPVRMMPLPAVFESMGAELARRASASGVALQFQASPPAVAVEVVVAQAILSNLIVNAIKYADGGKEDRWVKIRAETIEADPGALVVEVADNGLGIPASLQHRVFGRRFRAHPQVAEGTGLGLAITREILAARGGGIDLVSEEGVGTTVRAVLRAGSVSALASRQNHAASYN